MAPLDITSFFSFNGEWIAFVIIPSFDDGLECAKRCAQFSTFFFDLVSNSLRPITFFAKATVERSVTKCNVFGYFHFLLKSYIAFELEYTSIIIWQRGLEFNTWWKSSVQPNYGIILLSIEWGTRIKKRINRIKVHAQWLRRMTYLFNSKQQNRIGIGGFCMGAVGGFSHLRLNSCHSLHH